MRNDFGFGGAHPYAQLLFFVSSIGFSMFINHPVSIIISLVCAFLYYMKLTDGRNVKRNILVCIPFAIFTAVINTAFNHRGAVVLAYLPGGNPITLESAVNGFGAAGTVLSVLFWFGCLSRIFTTDKVIYVFGKAAPSLALVVSMALGFVPRFLRYIKQVSNAQKCIGEVETGTIGKIKNGLNVLSAAVTWAFENGTDTADSMVSRGYGTGERTFFNIFSWEKRDTLLTVIIAALVWLNLYGISRGRFYWSRVFIDTDFLTAETVIWQVMYAALMLAPFLYDMYVQGKWEKAQSSVGERRAE